MLKPINIDERQKGRDTEKQTGTDRQGQTAVSLSRASDRQKQHKAIAVIGLLPESNLQIARER